MNRITHSVGTAGVAPAQLPSGNYRLTTGVALSSGYLLTVVSFSPALAATPNLLRSPAMLRDDATMST